MARPLRIEYSGAMYHITSRGNECGEIFIDDKDNEKFVQILKEGADFFRVEVIAYCLMGNHFHLLIRTREANLSRFMQWVNASYTRNFNYRHKRVGHLLQGRYKSIIVGSDEYFSVLSRYIHLNPVRIKSCKNKKASEKAKMLNSYKWSSYRSVIDPGKRSKYFKVEEALLMFGGDTAEGRRKYEEYVFEGINAVNEKSPLKEIRYQLVLGSDKFFEWVKDNFIKPRDLKPHTHLKGIMAIPVKDIADAVASSYQVKIGDIIEKKSKHNEARSILIELSYLLNIHSKSMTEIGRELGGISGSGVCYAHKRIRDRLNKDKDFKENFDGIATSLHLVNI